MVTALSIGNGGLGRFGNQMWTIAGCIGIARANNMDFAFPKWVNHDNALFGDNADEMSQYFVNTLPIIPDGVKWHDYGYFWGYRDINLNRTINYNIDAHLQSPKFFDHCIEDVRHYFTLKNEPEQNEYCAIHVRAGDYIDDPNAYHPRCSKDYYMAAMDQMPKNTKYIVFTDDIDFARQRLDMNDLHFSSHYITDFAVMKKCKHFIIANSSFSAMAAILADHPEKIVIAPERWFGKHVDISAKDIYHQNWIII
jgi:hypothetical protein